MLDIEISTKETIDLLEGEIHPYQYFRNVPVQEFWESLSNGKTVRFHFTNHEDYTFGYKTLSFLLLRYLQKKITYKELKFLLEVISLLLDDWSYEGQILEDVTALYLTDFK